MWAPVVKGHTHNKQRESEIDKKGPLEKPKMRSAFRAQSSTKERFHQLSVRRFVRSGGLALVSQTCACVCVCLRDKVWLLLLLLSGHHEARHDDSADSWSCSQGTSRPSHLPLL